MSTATTSTGSSLSGIFAKFVAKFLVKWVKRTLGIGQAPPRPALSSTPSHVEGRPDRDRGRETFGAHTGGTGPRADETPRAADALQGDDYGAHRGTDAACHVAPVGPRLHSTDPEHRRAAVWDVDARLEASNALRSADAPTLRAYGLDERQVEQCGGGRVPSGHLLDRVQGPDQQSTWQLSPVSPDNQLLANAFHHQLIDVRIGDTRILSIPFGDQNVILVLGPASPPLAMMAGA